MKRFFGTLALAAPLFAASAITSGFDGSKRLICAPVDAHECVEGVRCSSSTPRTIGAARDNPIATVTRGEHQLLLTGTELDWGWTMTIDAGTAP